MIYKADSKKPKLIGQMTKTPPFVTLDDIPPINYMEGGVVVESEVHKKKKPHPFKRNK